MNKFKVGDRVQVLSSYAFDSRLINRFGKVIEEGSWTGIEFENSIFGGHSCDGKGKHGYCYRISEEDLMLIGVSGTIVIYPKGRETIAIQKDGNKVVKTAKAICNPNDVFNLEHGAKLALARLFNEKVVDIAVEEVKRDVELKRIARKNEWVKVVDHDAAFEYGTIAKCIREDSDSVNLFAQDGMQRFMNRPRYVVLENHDPGLNKNTRLTQYTTRELTAELLRRCDNE